jgi:hypothetical protein
MGQDNANIVREPVLVDGVKGEFSFRGEGEPECAQRREQAVSAVESPTGFFKASKASSSPTETCRFSSCASVKPPSVPSPKSR